MAKLACLGPEERLSISITGLNESGANLAYQQGRLLYLCGSTLAAQAFDAKPLR